MTVSRKLQGALWKTLSCLCFAIINNLIKYLGQSVPFVQLAFLEHAFAVIWLFPFLSGVSFRPFQHNCWFLHLARALLSVLGVLLWYQALLLLPVAQGVALGFLGPFTTLLGAILFFREKLTSVRFIAFLRSILGGGLITGAFSIIAGIHFSFHTLLPIASSVAFSMATLLNKKLTQTEHPLVIVFSLMIPMTIFLGALSWPLWQPLTLNLWVLCLFLGGITALAHFSVARSFAFTDVLFLLPIGSLRFILSALLAFWFFGHMPAPHVILGFLIIFLALFCLSVVELRRPKNA